MSVAAGPIRFKIRELLELNHNLLINSTEYHKFYGNFPGSLCDYYKLVGINMSVTALRQKDWIFNAFWVACGEASAPKCAVRIPITCIFREGEPFKALGCDQFGIVKRIILEKEDVVRGDMDKGFRGKFRVLRKLLIDYSTENDYENVQLQNNQSPKICSVRKLLRNYCDPLQCKGVVY